jgi:hypothetical protein
MEGAPEKIQHFDADRGAESVVTASVQSIAAVVPLRSAISASADQNSASSRMLVRRRPMRTLRGETPDMIPRILTLRICPRR